uniref:COesterase domain-containing protein n=1 Tax=Bursaphelenchus xylophilus TaxID=6326 RepID=A0A1I7RWM4_BURXY
MKHLFLFITCFVCYTCAVEVGTTNGVVSGVQLLTGDQKVNVWRGVPYANPPTNEQRFHYAVAKDAWTGRYNATFYRPNCYPGYSLDNVATSYSEDCLYINIFADNRCLSKLCPVIFYINSSPYDLREDPKFNENLIVKKFASKNFVVVVPQYRQGIFGNLDLGRSTGSAPYNLQLWDLIQALEWTNHEIGSFGGASDRVALMGQGAGADDVIYLATSTRINPSHFNRIIVFSGIAPILYHPSQKISVEVSETVGVS